MESKEGTVFGIAFGSYLSAAAGEDNNMPFYNIWLHHKVFIASKETGRSTLVNIFQ